METAFWDSSSLVPLCTLQPSTPIAESLSKQYGVHVWWATPIEIHGAFARLVRMRLLTPNGQVQALMVLDEIRSIWREVRPSDEIRDRAEHLLDRFPLRWADALQLAAALLWASGKPATRTFISGDAQLFDAARKLGFKAIQT